MEMFLAVDSTKGGVLTPGFVLFFFRKTAVNGEVCAIGTAMLSNFVAVGGKFLPLRLSRLEFVISQLWA
jgi:hypothetical protein